MPPEFSVVMIAYRVQFWLVVAIALCGVITSVVYLHCKLTLVHSETRVEKVTSNLQDAVTGEKHNLDVTATETKLSGHILCNTYYGQQGSAIRTLMSLQCWAASFFLPMHENSETFHGGQHPFSTS